jgi:hypothetical protein
LGLGRLNPTNCRAPRPPVLGGGAGDGTSVPWLNGGLVKNCRGGTGCRGIGSCGSEPAGQGALAFLGPGRRGCWRCAIGDWGGRLWWEGCARGNNCCRGFNQSWGRLGGPPGPLGGSTTAWCRATTGRLAGGPREWREGRDSGRGRQGSRGRLGERSRLGDGCRGFRQGRQVGLPAAHKVHVPLLWLRGVGGHDLHRPPRLVDARQPGLHCPLCRRTSQPAAELDVLRHPRLQPLREGDQAGLLVRTPRTGEQHGVVDLPEEEQRH